MNTNIEIFLTNIRIKSGFYLRIEIFADVILPAPAAKMFIPPFIHVMDASYNQLAAIPKSFLEQVAPALRRLDLSHNR